VKCVDKRKNEHLASIKSFDDDDDDL